VPTKPLLVEPDPAALVAVMEWRCGPASPARIPEATDHDVTFIVICDEGYSSTRRGTPREDTAAREGRW
jgi:hypothetical protein